jgi:hypothetical protein
LLCASSLRDTSTLVEAKDPFDRVSTDLMAQVVERCSDSRATPARVLAGHSDDQLLDFDGGLQTTWPNPR